MEGVPSKRGAPGFNTKEGRETMEKGKILAWLEKESGGRLGIFSWDDVEEALREIRNDHDPKSRRWKQPVFQIINKQYHIGWVREEDSELLWQRWDPRRKNKPGSFGRFRLTSTEERVMLQERNDLWKLVRSGEVSRITVENEGRVIRIGENARLRRERNRAQADLRTILEGLHRLLSKLLDH